MIKVTIIFDDCPGGTRNTLTKEWLDEQDGSVSSGFDSALCLTVSTLEDLAVARQEEPRRVLGNLMQEYASMDGLGITESNPKLLAEVMALANRLRNPDGVE